MPKVQHCSAGRGSQKPQSRMLGADTEFAVFKPPTNEAFIEAAKTFKAAALKRQIASANTLPSVESCSRPDASAAIEKSTDQRDDLVHLPLSAKPPKRRSCQPVQGNPVSECIFRELLTQKHTTAARETPPLGTGCVSSHKSHPRNAIAIEKNDPRCSRLFRGSVANCRRAKALVLMPDPLKARDPCGREALLKRLNKRRSLGSAAVICDDALEVAAILCEQPLEHASKGIGSVVGCDDHRHGGFRHAPPR